MEFQESGVEGQFRFLGRVYRFVTRNLDRLREEGQRTAADEKALRKLHQTIRKISQDFENRWHFNTSIAALMELYNEISALESELSGPVLTEILTNFALLLGPFAPFIAEELWEQLGRTGTVFHQPWPTYDEELAREEGAEIVVQVNGKLRSRMAVPFGTAREELERQARADDKIQPFLKNKHVLKVIVVPDKLVNIVVKG
jgi:leucyl-tRNA synthetase